MVWNRLITLITFVFLSLPAFGEFSKGQKYFIKQCEDSLSSDKAEFEWLKYLFKVETCTQVAEKLLTLKSYNEFLPPLIKTVPIHPVSWTEAKPEVYGIKSIYDTTSAGEIVKDYKVSYNTLFDDPTIYEDFKNLEIIDFSAHQFKFSICFILNRLENIKTAIVDNDALKKLEACTNLEKIPELIVTRDFFGNTNKAINQKIIGIEYHTGSVNRLGRYPNLRYVGIHSDAIDVRDLIQVQSLTHLSLSTTSGIPNLEELSEMYNLSFLGVSCVKDWRIFTPYKVVTHEVCETPKVTNIDFIRDLEWLEHINFSFNAITDASVLTHLKALKSVNLSHNQIEVMPDLSVLTNLSHIDISNNPLENR